MKQYYIYLTTNLSNNKKYIGKHYGEIDDEYLGSGTILKAAIQKYGRKNFVKQILYISQNEEENCKKEKEFIADYHAVESSEFYNIHVGGEGGNTTAGFSPEQKRALSLKLSERTKGENNPRYGVHLTQETKDKIRANRNTSYMKTSEYRKKMSIAVSGEKNGMYGKNHSEQSKLKMSINSKGKTSGPKNGMYGKRGDKAINGIKVGMFNESKELIKIFNAKTAVLQFLGLKGHTQLDNAIKNFSLYKGYYWKKL